MPTPRKGESKDEWVERCMGDDESAEDFPDRDQRFAFCNSRWEDFKKRQRRSRRRRGTVRGG